ncbi:MAG: serine/threonine protein kinase, partial [Deltaproteobacteria bacterium]|nr:serine/threonine protein kinase [Deltaproteobacteria bacterium]
MGLHSPGSVIAGRYEIVREIARGAMGIVYLARHKLSRKEVALKLLDPRASTSEAAMARFEREVSVRAETKHEGIVDVLDAGVA